MIFDYRFIRVVTKILILNDVLSPETRENNEITNVDDKLHIIYSLMSSFVTNFNRNPRVNAKSMSSEK